MRRLNVSVFRRWLAYVSLAILVVLMNPLQSIAEPPGFDIKIRAQNRSTTDTPFCGIGGGEKGDRLDVDAFMAPDGTVTGQARFEANDGTVTMFDVGAVFPFDVGGGLGGGIVLQDASLAGPVVAIWMNSLTLAPSMPILVNFEAPRGCGNTVSTFTPGVDKVTVQIKSR